MKYVIANLHKAKSLGYKEAGHLVRKTIICLNEKEVMNHPSLTGTLDERADKLGGSVATQKEAKGIMSGN